MEGFDAGSGGVFSTSDGAADGSTSDVQDPSALATEVDIEDGDNDDEGEEEEEEEEVYELVMEDDEDGVDGTLELAAEDLEELLERPLLPLDDAPLPASQLLYGAARIAGGRLQRVQSDPSHGIIVGMEKIGDCNDGGGGGGGESGRAGRVADSQSSGSCCGGGGGGGGEGDGGCGVKEVIEVKSPAAKNVAAGGTATPLKSAADETPATGRGNSRRGQFRKKTCIIKLDGCHYTIGKCKSYNR